jgi:lysozyme
MASNNRSLAPLPSAGPFIGEITNHLDSSFMGGVEVALITGIPANIKSQEFVYPVQYLNPFYGVTSARFEGNDSSKFNDVQKSYGMWFVPPDVGTKVLVIFVDGDPNQGYWMGCVMDPFQNHMIPGIAASPNTAMTQDQINSYGTTTLPVAEIHKKSQDLNDGAVVNKIDKAVHPFADRLKIQGLLIDNVRGVTSSSARREIPSAVFGVSTPGPVDTSSGAARGAIGYSSTRLAPVSRLGGSTFVMDDGDINGQNELVRIRTRTGHQILLHNSSDLIYIANSAGTAWLEMTSMGKIDIYAADSISIHSENDINFRADRDVNIEALRNLNLVASSDVQIQSAAVTSILAGDSCYIQSGADLNVTAHGDLSMAASADVNIAASDAIKIGGSGDVHVAAGGIMYQGAAGNFNVSAGGTYFETAQKIHMNGPVAAAPATPVAPDTTDPLPLFSLPNRRAGVNGSWENGQKFSAPNLTTILPRVPTHEPYDQHENKNPSQFSAANTDIQKSGGPASQTTGGISSSIGSLYPSKPNLPGTPPVKTGNIPQDNLNAFLWMIRCAEGTSAATGYQTMFTGALFNVADPTIDGKPNPTYNYAAHPNIINGKNTKTPSTAAGAYQFLYSTWKSCQKTLNLPDFSPQSQDLACKLLLTQTNSMDDILNGNFSIALTKNKKIWASLPGADYLNQSMRTYNFCASAYQAGGGTIVAV